MFPDLRPVMSLTQLDVPAVDQVASPITEMQLRLEGQRGLSTMGSNIRHYLREVTRQTAALQRSRGHILP